MAAFHHQPQQNPTRQADGLRIQPYQEIWAKPKAEWSAEFHECPAGS
jgi:hypothetical protein